MTKLTTTTNVETNHQTNTSTAVATGPIGISHVIIGGNSNNSTKKQRNSAPKKKFRWMHPVSNEILSEETTSTVVQATKKFIKLIEKIDKTLLLFVNEVDANKVYIVRVEIASSVDSSVSQTNSDKPSIEQINGGSDKKPTKKPSIHELMVIQTNLATEAKSKLELYLRKRLDEVHKSETSSSDVNVHNVVVHNKVSDEETTTSHNPYQTTSSKRIQMRQQ